MVSFHDLSLPDIQTAMREKNDAAKKPEHIAVNALIYKSRTINPSRTEDKANAKQRWSSAFSFGIKASKGNKRDEPKKSLAKYLSQILSPTQDGIERRVTHDSENIQRSCIESIYHLSCQPGAEESLIKAGVVEKMIEYAVHPSIQGYIAATMANLTTDSLVVNEFVQRGGISVLLELSWNSSVQIKTLCALTLCRLSMHPRVCRMMFDQNAILEIVAIMGDARPALQHICLKTIVNMVSHGCIFPGRVYVGGSSRTKQGVVHVLGHLASTVPRSCEFVAQTIVALTQDLTSSYRLCQSGIAEVMYVLSQQQPSSSSSNNNGSYSILLLDALLNFSRLVSDVSVAFANVGPKIIQATFAQYPRAQVSTSSNSDTLSTDDIHVRCWSILSNFSTTRECCEKLVEMRLLQHASLDDAFVLNTNDDSTTESTSRLSIERNILRTMANVSLLVPEGSLHVLETLDLGQAIVFPALSRGDAQMRKDVVLCLVSALRHRRRPEGFVKDHNRVVPHDDNDDHVEGEAEDRAAPVLDDVGALVILNACPFAQVIDHLLEYIHENEVVDAICQFSMVKILRESFAVDKVVETLIGALELDFSNHHHHDDDDDDDHHPHPHPHAGPHGGGAPTLVLLGNDDASTTHAFSQRHQLKSRLIRAIACLSEKITDLGTIQRCFDTFIQYCDAFKSTSTLALLSLALNCQACPEKLELLLAQELDTRVILPLLSNPDLEQDRTLQYCCVSIAYTLLVVGQLRHEALLSTIVRTSLSSIFCPKAQIKTQIKSGKTTKLSSSDDKLLLMCAMTFSHISMSCPDLLFGVPDLGAALNALGRSQDVAVQYHASIAACNVSSLGNIWSRGSGLSDFIVVALLRTHTIQSQLIYAKGLSNLLRLEEFRDTPGCVNEVSYALSALAQLEHRAYASAGAVHVQNSDKSSSSRGPLRKRGKLQDDQGEVGDDDDDPGQEDASIGVCAAAFFNLSREPKFCHMLLFDLGIGLMVVNLAKKFRTHPIKLETRRYFALTFCHLSSACPTTSTTTDPDTRHANYDSTLMTHAPDICRLLCQVNDLETRVACAMTLRNLSTQSRLHLGLVAKVKTLELIQVFMHSSHDTLSLFGLQIVSNVSSSAETLEAMVARNIPTNLIELLKKSKSCRSPDKVKRINTILHAIQHFILDRKIIAPMMAQELVLVLYRHWPSLDPVVLAQVLHLLSRACPADVMAQQGLEIMVPILARCKSSTHPHHAREICEHLGYAVGYIGQHPNAPIMLLLQFLSDIPADQMEQSEALQWTMIISLRNISTRISVMPSIQQVISSIHVLDKLAQLSMTTHNARPQSLIYIVYTFLNYCQSSAVSQALARKKSIQTIVRMSNWHPHHHHHHSEASCPDALVSGTSSLGKNPPPTTHEALDLVEQIQMEQLKQVSVIVVHDIQASAARILEPGVPELLIEMLQCTTRNVTDIRKLAAEMISLEHHSGVDMQPTGGTAKSCHQEFHHGHWDVHLVRDTMTHDIEIPTTGLISREEFASASASFTNSSVSSFQQQPPSPPLLASSCPSTSFVMTIDSKKREFNFAEGLAARDSNGDSDEDSEDEERRAQHQSEKRKQRRSELLRKKRVGIVIDASTSRQQQLAKQEQEVQLRQSRHNLLRRRSARQALLPSLPAS